MRDCYKYKRGQIWWVTANDVDDPEDGKTRPMLIFSNDIGNSSSNAIVAIPITSQHKSTLKVNVEFAYGGKVNTLMCNHIHSIDVSQIQGYYGVVSDFIMAKVESSVRFALCIEQNDIYLNELKEFIKDTFKDYLSKVQAEKSIDSGDEVVDDLKGKLIELRNELLKPDTLKAINEAGNVSVQKPVKEPIINKETVEKKEDTQDSKLKVKAQKRKKNGFWTDEVIIDFVNDTHKLSKEDAMKVWNIDSVKTYNTYRSKMRKIAKDRQLI